MDYNFILYSFLYAVASFSYFSICKSWLKDIKKKEGAFFKPDINVKIITDWIIIIGLAIASIVYFFKALW
jgi:hypothetical protein